MLTQLHTDPSPDRGRRTGRWNQSWFRFSWIRLRLFGSKPLWDIQILAPIWWCGAWGLAWRSGRVPRAAGRWTDISGWALDPASVGCALAPAPRHTPFPLQSGQHRRHCDHIRTTCNSVLMRVSSSTYHIHSRLNTSLFCIHQRQTAIFVLHVQFKGRGIGVCSIQTEEINFPKRVKKLYTCLKTSTLSLVWSESTVTVQWGHHVYQSYGWGSC